MPVRKTFPQNSDLIQEGNDNLYHTNDRVDARIALKYDYSIFNQAYIRSGKVVCNDTNHPEINTNTAKYIGVDMGHRIRKAEIRFGFTGDTGSSTVVLVTSKTGCNDTDHIVNGSCHYVITPTDAQIGYFNAGVLTVAHTYTFATPLLSNVEYTFKWERINDDSTGWLAMTLPDGEVKLITDAEWVTYNGQYIIFEHFYANSSARRSYFTAWKATGDNESGTKTYLRHDFTRQFDDLLNISQTGQIYALYSNDVTNQTQLGYI